MRPSQRLMAAGSLLLLSFGPTVSLTAQSQISPAPQSHRGYCHQFSPMSDQKLFQLIYALISPD
jgi:hypothetical protein